MLHKRRVRDSSLDSSVLNALQEQTDPAERPDRELAGLHSAIGARWFKHNGARAEAAWLPDHLVRSGNGLGAVADLQARPAAAA